MGCLFRLPAKPGISAVQLQRQLSIKKVDKRLVFAPQIAKEWYDRTVNGSQELEADETGHIGGPVQGITGRFVAKAKTKTLIAISIEIARKHKGRHFPEKAGRLL